MAMFKTEPKIYKEGRSTLRMIVQYGIDYDYARRYKQAPYFSITCAIDEQRGGRWRRYAGGAAHTEIARHFPELARLIKWHLVSTEEPMHYLANAQYWWEIWSGKKKNTDHGPNPLNAFESTIVWGGVPGETDAAQLGTYMNRPWPEVKAWLEGRLPLLMAEFRADMKAIGALEK